LTAELTDFVFEEFAKGLKYEALAVHYSFWETADVVVGFNGC
jgi:hypothetical protein